MSAPTAERYRSQSVGELLNGFGNDSSLLLRQELQLAKAELTEKAVAAGTGIALAVVAVVLLLGALGAAITAAIAALSYVVPVWAAALVTVGGLILLATIIGLSAALRLASATPPVPEKAIDLAKETPHELVH